MVSFGGEGDKGRIRVGGGLRREAEVEVGSRRVSFTSEALPCEVSACPALPFSQIFLDPQSGFSPVYCTPPLRGVRDTETLRQSGGDSN